VRLHDPSKAHISAFVRFFLLDLFGQNVTNTFLPLKHEMYRDQLQRWNESELKHP
jgi:hypothetical protein